MTNHMKTNLLSMARLCSLLVAALILIEGSALAADWMMLITVSSGPDEASVQIGSQIGASDWFDDALDTPSTLEQENLKAYLFHPEWNATMNGVKHDRFQRDIRFSLPQDYDISIEGGRVSVTVSWKIAEIPDKGQFWLHDAGTDTWVNMSKQESYTFTPSEAPSSITVRATWGDTCCYPLPSQ